MPAITIQSLALRDSQKEVIAEKYTTIFSNLTNVPKDRIYVFFDGYPLEDVAKGGLRFSVSPPQGLIAKFNEPQSLPTPEREERSTMDLDMLTPRILQTRLVTSGDPAAEIHHVDHCDAKVLVFEVNAEGSVSAHSHDSLRIVFVRSGSAMYCVGDRQQRISGGDVLTVLPGVVHHLKVVGDQPLHLCEVVVPLTAT